jgi:glycosyltransferase involved in cell wall biosynthesis
MILRAVESALAQSVDDLEVLVVDNHSTDGTWESLLEVTDPRVRLVRNSHNLGLFENFNRCLDLASGTYLRFLCSDDSLAPDCLRHELVEMEAHPGAVLLSSSARRVLPDGNVLGTHADHFRPGRYAGDIAIAGVLRFTSEYGFNPLNYPSGILLRTEAVRRAGYFDTTMRIAADVDLFLRVLLEGDLLIVDRRGCDITIHREQEGARLTGDPVVMQEQYLLLGRFGAALGSPRAIRHVANQLGGLCLRFAIRAWFHGETRSARQYIAMAHAEGCTFPGMAMAVARIAALRALLRAFGVRLLPDGFNGPVARRHGRTTTNASRLPRGTHAPGDATGA